MSARVHALVGLAIGVGLTGACGRAAALTVCAAPLEVLAEEAEIILQGEVLSTTAEPVPGEPYALRTRVVLGVWCVAKGPDRSIQTFDFVVPGGETAELVTVAPGVPRFAAGDRVVLLLEARHGEYLPLGYSLGTIWLDDDGTAWQHADPTRWLQVAADDLLAAWAGAW